MGVDNLTNINVPLADVLPSLVSNSIAPLMPFLKAISIAVLVYFIVLIVRLIFNIRRDKKLREIARDVSEINKKLDKLGKKK